MLFTELRFLPFFLVVFAVHWALKRNSWRKSWLLLASYAFYAAWDWRFLSLILGSTAVDYLVGIKLGGTDERRRRKAWILLSVCANLGLLGVFKYFDFFSESAAQLLSWLGFSVSLPVLDVVLPVGISFYTFQTMSYSLDVYFRKLEPVRSPLDLALFVGFFPQLVAGPIVRASYFLPQLMERRTFAGINVRGALVLFLAGFIKKACISDNLSPFVDQVFADPSIYHATSAWAGTLYYAVQIYCDFSGYSDMAIACAALLGYQIPLNFKYPYFAGSITEFWRRWHVSLSTWLRDYLYIPLGGSHGSRLFTYRNLMLTMLLGGLWHGAAWTFVIWGGLHGAALIVHKEWSRHVPEESPLRLATRVLGPLLTFGFVCVGWIFFRSEDFGHAWRMLRACALVRPDRIHFADPSFLWIFPLLIAAHWLTYQTNIAETWKRLPEWAFAAAYGAAVALTLAFVPPSPKPFIYFQF